MTPDVVVDIGNSRMKWGRCDGDKIAEVVALRHDDVIGWKRICEQWKTNDTTRWAISGVVPNAVRHFREWLGLRTPHVAVLTNELFIQERTRIRTTVDEPDRIGVDRLLGTLAAFRRTPRGHSAVAISVGTAMTIDFVMSNGQHVGGAILPGPGLMAQSLHERTAKLPHVAIRPKLPKRAWGTNTEKAIRLGIANAVLGAADQMVWDWAALFDKPPCVFATGGDVGYFRGFAFTATVEKFVVDPRLILKGIRLAAEALP